MIFSKSIKTFLSALRLLISICSFLFLFFLKNELFALVNIGQRLKARLLFSLLEKNSKLFFYNSLEKSGVFVHNTWKKNLEYLKNQSKELMNWAADLKHLFLIL